MFGFSFLKFQPSEYVLRYKKGKVISEGAGISFICRNRNTSVAVLPFGSIDCPFVFEELTSDFQNITIQGQLVFRINNQKQAVKMLNYVINLKGIRNYIEDNPQKKLSERLINTIKVSAKKQLENLDLYEAMKSSEKIALYILKDLKDSNEIEQLGIELLGLSLLAILPNKETARALEAKAREQILKNADDAVYERRNSSIEQERKVKENEYNTEISIENKKRQVQETQLEAKQAVQSKESELERQKIEYGIEIEKQKKELAELSATNLKILADSKAYELSVTMKALEKTDKNIIQSIASIGMEPQKLIALAFNGLAENATKIGQLNITPDLLTNIIKKEETETQQVENNEESD